MTVTYSWIIYSCLIFGTGILCDRKLEKRQAVSSCSVNTDDTFNCSNGLCIEWQLVCDGHEDCSDGSDEIKNVCAQYEFETNIAMACGRVNIKKQEKSEKGHQSIMNVPPWAVDIIYRSLPDSRISDIFSGSIIAPHIVISAASLFRKHGVTSKQTPINDSRYGVGSPLYTLERIEQVIKHYTNVTMIYLPGDYNPSGKYVNIAVIVLANKLSISNGYEPICIDWFGKYNVRKEAQIMIFSDSPFRNINIIQGRYQYTENITFNHDYWADKITNDIIGIKVSTELGIYSVNQGSGLGVLYSSNYFLTGIMSAYEKNIEYIITRIYFQTIKKYVPWIRGIVYKHTTVNSCVLPTVDGVIYSYEGTNEILSHGTLIDRQLNVIENCDVGYHKAYPNGFRFCLGKGKWFASSDKLCFKSICPPLLSDSLDIKCSYNSNYANCSNMSIPGTIATTSCKPTYALPNGQKQTSLELRCLANGTWDNELNRCYADFCVLPTVEGVVYTYEDSNETLSPGTLIDLHLTVNENCTFGYYKAYTNSFRICMRNGKWKTVTDKLCFKMCSPLESDSLDIKCSHNGMNTNCSKLSIPDTIAIPSCKTSYTAPYGLETEPFELHCQYDGMWDKKLYRCKPNCGYVYSIYNTLINDGIIAPFETAPWNVGVYRLNIKTSNYDLICGGSIVSSNLVLSAAHCFLDENRHFISRNMSINDDRYKIAVGKYDRNLTIIDNAFTKIMNVKTVYLYENYDGTSGWHFGDIAIIVLQKRVSFSSGVAPVCIDWTGQYNVVNGDKGKVVGWGKTENNIDSPILLEASLPYIDRTTCKKKYSNGFESYVTADKFCAGSESGQGVRTGDSGAGLSFIHFGLHYLTGVTSVKDTDTNYSIAAFTEIKFHIQWIRRLYNEHN